ncbi:MAG: FMN-binding protein [Paludibacter sp.]|nr:FMN-binding protein [Paludibacter sp.]
MSKLYLLVYFIACIQLTVFAVPDSSDRQLQRELKKVYSKQNIELIEMPVPAKYSLTGKYYQVNTTSDKETVKYIYIGRINTVRSANAKANSNESSEYFDYFIFFDEGKSISQVRVINYQATHGEKVSSPGWLRNFVGHNRTKPLEVGRQIDAISGATISVNSITFDVRQKTHILSELVRK